MQLQQLGFVIKEDTFRSNQLCMLESHNYDIPIGIQLVDMESDFTMFLAFKELLISDSIVLDSYNLLKKIQKFFLRLNTDQKIGIHKKRITWESII